MKNTSLIVLDKMKEKFSSIRRGSLIIEGLDGDNTAYLSRTFLGVIASETSSIVVSSTKLALSSLFSGFFLLLFLDRKLIK